MDLVTVTNCSIRGQSAIPQFTTGSLTLHKLSRHST